jgi:predicted O-methyltransferase YrrM
MKCFHAFAKSRLLTPLAVASVEDETISMAYKGVAGCEVVRVTDALATMEEMANGQGALRPAPFDLVFVDADKTRLLEYVEACVTSDRVLKKGGMIVVDNVLWKGLVLEAATGDFSRVDNESEDEQRQSRRARKLAIKMHFFNHEIVKDNRVEVVVLPMRDGLSVIRKR